jgi:RNA polymerase primary sigma factor
MFIEDLGWDRFTTSLSTSVGDTALELTGIAQKKGVVVFLCRTERTVLANRGLLRQIQRALRKRYHEHILITVCETPRKQVWQWATLGADGHHVVHREHPFFSHAPPPRLLERLRRLNISIDEEEQLGLIDVVARMREALSPINEFNLFAKWPKFAAKSDRLAMALKRGEPGAFHRFVEFHLPLARHASRMLNRWVDLDPEDAEQTAMIGLIEAARRFDPERGYQFSTYAGHWLRQSCQRHGIDYGLFIRIPPHIFWPCYRMDRDRQRRYQSTVDGDSVVLITELCEQYGIDREIWERFIAAQRVTRLSELDKDELRAFRQRSSFHLMEDIDRTDVRDRVEQTLNTINRRFAQVLRLRYGLDGFPKTLEEAGSILGVTRERVRQLQKLAEKAFWHRITGVPVPPKQRRSKSSLPPEPSEPIHDDPA